MSRRPESERSDWTDLDLLTRDEAYGRLQEEITATVTRLAELGDCELGAFDEAERELLGARLRALREAAEELTDNSKN